MSIIVKNIFFLFIVIIESLKKNLWSFLISVSHLPWFTRVYAQTHK